MPHGLNVVLVEPDIPWNTGAIGRVCLAVGATLHLVEPLGFELTHKQVLRAGLDYWEHVPVRVYESLAAFLETLPGDARVACISTKGAKTIYDHAFTPGAYLLFGKETAGLPPWLLDRYPDATLRIPQYDDRVRSLNLANAASIVIYEALRQLGV